jgi:hypothetical protein
LIVDKRPDFFHLADRDAPPNHGVVSLQIPDIIVKNYQPEWLRRKKNPNQGRGGGNGQAHHQPEAFVFIEGHGRLQAESGWL